MIKQYLLNEDTLPSKLPVVYSEEIINEIEAIKDYNQFEKEGLSKLFSYIKWVQSHVSNRAIAFDYGSNFSRYPDGTTIINNIGIGFCIEDNSKEVYVRIVWIDLNPEEFGLEIPLALNESKRNKNTAKKVYYLTESHLHSIIKEVIKTMLLSA